MNKMNLIETRILLKNVPKISLGSDLTMHRARSMLVVAKVAQLMCRSRCLLRNLPISPYNWRAYLL